MLYQGSDGQVHVLGDGEELKHWKYIKKIKSGNGWRYFYSQDEINAYMKEAQGAAKGVKNKIDSIPRLEKHGDKYYIADKKTQRKIEKSGAGGNALRKKGKAIGVYTLSDKTRNEAWSREYKQRAKENEGSVFKKAGELAKSKAYEGAAKGIPKKYEKYEAKNVVNRKLSDIKKKIKKKNKGKNKVDTIKEKKIKEKKITENKIRETKTK